MCCPYKKDVTRQKDYHFCKDGFAIIVLAGCGVDGRFNCATAWNSGSTNDIKVCKDSDLYQYLVGDEAFTNTSQLLSPWCGCGLDHYQDAFNYCFFLQVDTMLGYFLGTLCFFFASMVFCCTKLHNLCLGLECGHS